LLPKQSVLIVDESVETRTVLRTALEHPGRRVLEATGADEALRLAHQFHPSVIVLDVEIDHSATHSLAADFQSESLQSSSMVLLGTARRVAQGFSRGEFVAKPYHYGPLVRKIEKLLDAASRPAAA